MRFDDSVGPDSQPPLFFILELPGLPPSRVSLPILRNEGSLRLDDRQRGETHIFCGLGDVGRTFTAFDGATQRCEPTVKQVQLSARFRVSANGPTHPEPPHAQVWRQGHRKELMISRRSFYSLRFLAKISFFLVAAPDALQGVDEEIYTYQLTQANPVDYLTQLQSQADRLAARPELWIPWSYCKALT